MYSFNIVSYLNTHNRFQMIRGSKADIMNI
uniref:Uncharacterized protein n=1 Tax=Arundo donax TaxID=35708 RepID=A0A0A9B0I2_ARUDO